jgi:hypothetical protein
MVAKAQPKHPASPASKPERKLSGKPSANATVKEVPKEEKKKRDKVAAARFPTPSAKGIPNPLLVSNRNKRALCVAFAHRLGGRQGTPEQDRVLVKAIRESGVLWKSGMTLENFTDETNNSHLSQAEQSGNGYAQRCGRGRHDDYMQKYPEKVEACLDFVDAFLAMTATEGEEYEKLRQVEIDNVEALRLEIRKLQEEAKEAEAAKKKNKKGKVDKKPIASGKPSAGKLKGKPSKDEDEDAGDDDADNDTDDGDSDDT